VAEKENAAPHNTTWQQWSAGVEIAQKRNKENEQYLLKYEISILEYIMLVHFVKADGPTCRGFEQRHPMFHQGERDAKGYREDGEVGRSTDQFDKWIESRSGLLSILFATCGSSTPSRPAYPCFFPGHHCSTGASE
jgi:hypothetical protein